MTTDKYISKLIRLALMLLPVAAFIIYVAYLIQAIYVERALYADGANFFLGLLSKAHSWPIVDDSKHIRLFVNIINQFPTVFALKLGVTSLYTLKILFGAGLFLFPLFFYFYCIYLSRRANDYRVLFFSVASLITCAIPSDMFILNQAFTSLALSWIIIHYLLLDLKIKWGDWAVCFIISLVLFRAHESLIVWGWVFFIGAAGVIVFRDHGNVNNKNLVVYTIGILGVLQSAFVAFWQFSHPVGEQTSAFLQLILLLKPSELWVGNTRISVLMSIAVILIFVVQGGFKRKQVGGGALKVFASVGLIFVLGWMLLSGISALEDYSLTNPVREFDYRFLMTFGSSGWMLLAIVFVLANKNISNKVSSLGKITLAVGIISASLWQISNNLQWSIFKNATSQVLQNSSVSIIDPIEVHNKLVAEGNGDVYKYRWGWAWPVFGMSLQKEWVVEKLYKPEGFEMYFNPPRSIPFIKMTDNSLFVFDRFVAPSESAK